MSLALLLLLASGPAHATCGAVDTALDSGEGDEDCDADGWSKAQGDCDDEDEARNPGKDERCDLRGDEDCDGLVDEGCVDPIIGASLQGGTTCGPVAPAAVGALALAAALARRRRR